MTLFLKYASRKGEIGFSNKIMNILCKDFACISLCKMNLKFIRELDVNTNIKESRVKCTTLYYIDFQSEQRSLISQQEMCEMNFSLSQLIYTLVTSARR
jgi:hypothetical protein